MYKKYSAANEGNRLKMLDKLSPSSWDESKSKNKIFINLNRRIETNDGENPFYT